MFLEVPHQDKPWDSSKFKVPNSKSEYGDWGLSAVRFLSKQTDGNLDKRFLGSMTYKDAQENWKRAKQAIAGNKWDGVANRTFRELFRKHGERIMSKVLNMAKRSTAHVTGEGEGHLETFEAKNFLEADYLAAGTGEENESAVQNVVVSLGELLKVRDGHLDTVSGKEAAASEEKVAADRNRAEAMMDRFKGTYRRDSVGGSSSSKDPEMANARSPVTPVRKPSMTARLDLDLDETVGVKKQMAKAVEKQGLATEKLGTDLAASTRHAAQMQADATKAIAAAIESASKAQADAHEKASRSNALAHIAAKTTDPAIQRAILRSLGIDIE